MKRVAVVLLVLALVLAGALYLLLARPWASDRLAGATPLPPTLAATAELLPPSPTPAPAVTRVRVTPTPDPATVLPASLTAALDPAIDPDHFDGRAPIVITFDRPVNTAIAARPLVIVPAVAGRYSWNREATVVTFIPIRRLTSGKTYNLTPSERFVGRDGATFDPLPAWTLHVATAPRVTGRTPMTTKGSDRQPEFRLSFNRPMDAASVEAALTVSPDVALDRRWDGDDLLLRPAAPLNPGVQVNFEVGISATDATGITLESAYRFLYTPTALITAITGPSHDAPNAPLRLTFGYPLAPEARDLLVVDPPLAGEWVWQGDTILSLADPALLGGETYTFGFSAGPTTAAGETLPAPDEPFTFAASSPVVSFSPSGQSVHVSEPLKVTFDRPMDQEATTAALLIGPTTEGTTAWDGNTLTFTPTDGWETSSDYTVTLTIDAADAAGRPVLARGLVKTFRTSSASTVVGFGIGPQTQVVDADGRRAVQFTKSVNAALTVDFDLLPIDETGLVNRLSLNVVSDWNDQPDPIDVSGLSPAFAWHTEAPAADPDHYSQALETLLPAEAAPGLYVLRLTSRPDDRHLLVALSRLTLAAKLSPGELVVWVSDTPTFGRVAQPDGAAEGAPTPGATVRVYAANGRLLAEGLTDARGVARLALSPEFAPHVVIAQSGDDVTFSGLTSALQSSGWRYVGDDYDARFWRGDGVPRFAVHIQTDRPIYRPGQTVSYKAILRLEDDGAVVLPPEGTQAIVRLRDARDNVVRTQWLATDAFGAVYDSFDLAEGAMLGEYRIEVRGVDAGGAAETHTQSFQVEEYRKPDFAVTVTAAPEVVAGEPLTVTVRAEYLFGQPVANAKVTVNLYQSNGYWSTDDTYWWGGWEPVATVTTDAAGEASFTVTPEKRNASEWWWTYNRAAPWRVAVEATVDDGSAQTVSGLATSTVHIAAEAVSLDIGGYTVPAGEPFPVTAAVMTTIGAPQPVAGRALAVTLRQWDSRTYDYSHVVQTGEWVSGPDGALPNTYTVPRPGYYRLRLTGTDAAGRQLFAERYFYALGEGEGDFEASRFGFSISADRDSYAPGDTARLLLRSNFAGPALLTFERAATHREMPVVLTPPITVVDVPILPEDTPNIHVTLNAWEPMDTALTNPEAWIDSSRPDAELRTAKVDLLVPPTEKALTVTITTDRDAYAPRDTAAVVVRVTDAAGQPVAAQVALALVDEAIFLLAEDNTPLMFDAFYYPRPNGVRTLDAMRPRRLLYQGGLGGGGGDDSSALRADFPDTAAWFPALLTDANGEARLSLTLPDSLTTWRLTARAVTTSTQVGEARATFLTQQDVIVRPILPREMTAGDHLALSAAVHNYTAAPLELAVTLSEDGGLLAIDTATQTITLAPAETRIVGWPVTVIAAGQATAIVRAEPTGDGSTGEGSGDAVALPLAARPLAVPVVATQSGDFDGATTLTITVPAGTLPEHSAVTLELSRSPAGSLLNGLEFLTGFPYGCVEQTMSRALPNVAVDRAFDALGAPQPEGLELGRLVNESAQRLYGFQHDDGGWGWWFDDDSTPYQTAWVVFGLATMVEAGHEIDPAVIERGAAYLNDNLDKADNRTRAMMLYSLAVAGQPNGAAALELAALPDDDLDPFSLAALALALDAAGETAAAQTVMDRLAAQVIVADGRAHWGVGRSDGEYRSKTMASATRSTALALRAFVRLRPGDPLAAPAVRWLMAQRRGLGWGTTNETAYTILALADHVEASGLGETALSAGVALDGAPPINATLAAGELSATLTLPAEALTPGEHSLTVSGDSRVFYTLHEDYAVGQAQIDADGPLAVSRQFLAPNGKPLGEVHVGDLVLVRLRVNVPGPTYFALVEDRPVAGLEPLNERLNTTSRAANYYDGETYYHYYDYDLSWSDLGYNYKEIRDGRVTFFISTLTRSTSFEYLARATHSGEFSALPAEAWAMYELDTWGRSASDTLAILAAEE